MRAPGGPRPVFLGIGVVLALLGGTAAASAALVPDPTQLYLGTLMIGRPPMPGHLIVRNLSGSLVRLQGFSLTGPHPSDFVLTPPSCPSTLGPGGACLLELRFTPTQPGFRQAFVTVQSTDPAGPLQVPVFGNALPTSGELYVNPGSVAFPDVGLGSVGAGVSVTLSNGGLADLHIASIQKGGPHTLDFQKTATCDQAVIPPGGQCTLSVAFAPQQYGNRSASLVITSDSDGVSGAQLSVPLSGHTAQPLISFSPAPLDFGSRSVGTFGTGSRQLSITNTGNATLFASGVSVSGGQAGDFVIPGSLSCTLAPGQTCSFPVNFVPTAFGARSASLTVTSNVPGTPTVAALTGAGTFPATPTAPFTDDHRFLSAGSTSTPVCNVAGSPSATLSVGVSRFVGAVPTGGGRLVAPGPLVAAGALGPTATLEIMAYNASVGAGQSLPRVIFNGTDVGALAAGTAGAWSLTTLTVPIGTVNFPARGAPPSLPAPTAAANTLSLNVTAGGPNRCTALGWVRLSFLSLSPVIMVHGDSSNGAFFVRRRFAGALDAIGIPNDRSINLGGASGTATVATNAATLNALLPPIVRSFGVNSVHVVAHSKGGLDMRAWLGTFGSSSPFSVISLTTLGTPHRGSALADAKLAATATSFGVPGLPGAIFVALGLPGVSAFDLSTFSTAFFNPPLPANADYRMVGSDADRNLDGLITQAPVDEYAGARAEAGFTTGSVSGDDALATTVYQFMRNVRTVVVAPVLIPVPFFPFLIPALVPAPVPGFFPTPNDLLVNTASSLGGPPPFVAIAGLSRAAGRDHADVADPSVAAIVIPFLVTTDTVRGDLR